MIAQQCKDGVTMVNAKVSSDFDEFTRSGSWTVAKVALRVTSDNSQEFIILDDVLYERVMMQRAESHFQSVHNSANHAVISTPLLKSIRARINNGGVPVKGTHEWREEMKVKILAGLRSGKTVKLACDDVGIKSASLRWWKNGDVAFVREYEEAKRQSRIVRRMRKNQA